MSQKNMRTRNLDHGKPITIYDSTREDVLDKMDQQGAYRHAIQPPTGIEKEEESEHHLQIALVAVQSGFTNDIQGIPVPTVEEIKDTDHHILYPSGYKKEKELYRVQGLSSGPEPDVVDYCIDEADEAWLKEIGTRLTMSVDRFESAIDRLEKATGAQYMSENDACKLLKDRTDVVSAIHAYWLAKRRRLSHPLVPKVRTETKRDSGSGHDPYVAFRRRAEKMQTRKNRKSDELNYVLMFKMRIAHTQLMRDGLMDILKGVRERETLKLRTSLMERHEWQLGNAFFDDPAGFYQSHLLDNYPELNRIEAETLDEVEQDEVDREPSEAKEELESLEEFSDISDSGNESDSWSHIHHPDLKNRSPPFDEREDSASNFASIAPLDPNLVPELQYRGEEPPEYWGPDGEFTFVPRKDCKYYQVKEECDTPTADQFEDPLKGFFLQEIPVLVGRSTVMKTVLGRRTYGRQGTKHLEYYKLPDCLDALDLSLLYQPDTQFMTDELNTLKNAICETKEPVYVHCEAAIKEEFPVPEEPVRWNLTEEDVEDLFQAALRWPLDSEPPVPGISEEDFDHYQLACTSVNQPLIEHSYCKHPSYGNLDWLDAQTGDGDAEEVASQVDGTDSASVDSAGESLSLGVQPVNPSPAASFEGDFALPTPTAVLSLEMTSGKKRPPAKKPKAATAAKQYPAVTGVKRKGPEQVTPKEAAASPKKPPRKRAKGAGITEDTQSENLTAAATPKVFEAFQVPQIPPSVTPIITGAPGRNVTVKRKSPAPKTPNGLQNGDDGMESDSKKPKKKATVAKKGKEESSLVNLVPATLQSTTFTVAPPKSPPNRVILPLNSTTAGSVAPSPAVATMAPAASPATLTYPSTLRPSLPLNIGAAPRGLTSYTTNSSNPHLHSLLINNTGSTPVVANGYATGPVVQNGMNSMVVTSKMC